MAKSIVSSFSYPLAKHKIVERAEKIAKSQDKSLSQVILELLEELGQEQKNEEGAFLVGPLGNCSATTNNTIQIPSIYADIDTWNWYADTLDMDQLTRLENRGQTLKNIANTKRMQKKFDNKNLSKLTFTPT